MLSYIMQLVLSPPENVSCRQICYSWFENNSRVFFTQAQDMWFLEITFLRLFSGFSFQAIGTTFTLSALVSHTSDSE